METFNVGIAFAGLLFTFVSALGVLAYRLGAQSNRITAHGARILKLEEGEDGDGAKREALALQLKGMETKLDIELKHFGDDLAKVGRGVEGLQRGFGNLTSQGYAKGVRSLPEND